MADNDLAYLLRRSGEERIKASEATDICARAAHLGMADAYDRKLSNVAEATPVEHSSSECA